MEDFLKNPIKKQVEDKSEQNGKYDKFGFGINENNAETYLKIYNKINEKNNDSHLDGSDNNSSKSPTNGTLSDQGGKINEENSAKTSSEIEPSSSTQTTEEEKDKEDDKDAKKKKNRCAECRKKIGLTGFQCRCGKLFCAVHRYSDKHDCTFNYREHGAQEIRRNNPVVVGEKIQKI